jgi:hypothetical protein
VVFRWSIITDNQVVGVLKKALEPKNLFPINRTILLLMKIKILWTCTPPLCVYIIWNCYFLLNYVTRFPENLSESESRIVRLIGNRFLGSSAFFKTPTTWLSVIIDHRNLQTRAVPAGLDNLILIGEEIKKRTFQLGSQGGGGVDRMDIQYPLNTFLLL